MKKNPHKIPIGTLVETNNGMRLYVVAHEIESDQKMARYGLSFNRFLPHLLDNNYELWAVQLSSGYPESSLKVVGDCKTCKFWGHDYNPDEKGRADCYAFHRTEQVKLDIDADDDQGLDATIWTAPDFSCKLYSYTKVKNKPA